MISKDDHAARIAKANASIENAKGRAALDPFRLCYHFMAPAYWMNDPNGFIQYKGEYHLFYQHHPYSSEWGPMHWWHAKSRDLVHWEHLPIALAPGELYDEGGCYSGSAVDDNGKLTLVYTGHVEGGSPKQTQCLAVSEDGVTFHKHPMNPVIAAHPKDGSEEFRDPKVWRHREIWRMIVGTGQGEIGKVALYESEDLTRWTYAGIPLESDGTQGFMWECPDLFPLGEEDTLLIISPMGMNGIPNLNAWFQGRWDEEARRLFPSKQGLLDYGTDFYAAQSLQDKEGRRIIIAWMDMWGAPMPTQNNGWAGAMTLPREVSLFSDGGLCIEPVQELASLRVNARSWQEGLSVFGEFNVQENVPASFELELEFDLKQSDANCYGLKLRCSDDGQEQTVIRYIASTCELEVDRSRSGIAAIDVITRYHISPAQGEDRKCKLRIYGDTSSLEIFVNDGRAALTFRIFPSPDSRGIQLFADGGKAVVGSFCLWDMREQL